MLVEKNIEIDFGDFLPKKELTIGNHYWFLFSPEQTGITLVGLKDKDTGLILSTTLVNSENRSPSVKAWAGARHSRSADHPWEILKEIVDKNVDADKKMNSMAVSYGHASIADMARIQVDFTDCPMHLAFELFALSSINSGQEKSTRYQGDFKTTKLHDVRNYLPENINSNDLLNAQAEYQKLGDLSLDSYSRQRDILVGAFTDFYKPENKKEEDSLFSRVLDCSRSFLLFGNLGGLSFESSARDFSRISGILKASPVSFYQKTGSLIESFLAPSTEVEEKLNFRAEAPGLIRHTGAQINVVDNLLKLKIFLETQTDINREIDIETNFQQQVKLGVLLFNSQEHSQGEKVAMQYILSLWPGMESTDVMDWLKSQNTEVKRTISEIILDGHTNYKELPDLANVNSLSLKYNCSIGEIRDFNRHRAWGRFLPLPTIYGLPLTAETAYQILAKGYILPRYLTKIGEFAPIKSNFEDDLKLYYENLYKFVGTMERNFGSSIDYSFVVNLLPMAHKFEFFMHGNPKQALYKTHQRSRNGGHINYRELAYQANQMITDTDPYLSGMRLKQRPDPANRFEFFDRS